MTSQVKGTVLMARQAFIYKKADDTDREKLLSQLGAVARTLMTSRPLPALWYPYALHDEINQAIVNVLGKGNMGILREAGAMGAEVNVRGIYRAVFLVASPEMIISKVDTVWKTHYSVGQAMVLSKGKKRVAIGLKEFPEKIEPVREIMLGWSKRLVEMCGGKNVVAAQDPSPPADPGLQLVFSVSWE